MHLPAAFLYQMETQLGSEFASFLLALEKDPPVSLHCHPKKISAYHQLREHIPWHPEYGRYLETRPVFTLDPSFHAGSYYVQEASSMFVAQALRQTIDMQKEVKILDLCAAPGGKSTLLSSILNERSLLLSNEVIQSRYATLVQNLIKWGMPNTFSCSHDPADFAGLEGYFDAVLIDAPCSGEGLFRKDPAAALEWSAEQMQRCAARQRRILAAAVALLRTGGVLLYSTCTFNPIENEDNCRWLLHEFDFEHCAWRVPDEWGVVAGEMGYHFYPHRTKGEGFFLAAFRKTGESGKQNKRPKAKGFKHLELLSKSQRPALIPFVDRPEAFEFFSTSKGLIRALPLAHIDPALDLDVVLHRKAFGIEIGEFKGKDFIPSHDLALSMIIRPDHPAISLDLEQALQFLKKEIPSVQGEANGWVLAQYERLNLGWMKVLPQRINNYLPSNWRIRMEV